MGNLRFIFGPSGSGKTFKIYNEILERAAKEPERSFLIIVPDQFTMQTQRDLSGKSAAGGILNIDVLSFGRLTHRIMTEVGWKELPVLDDTGKSLVLQRVAGRISDKLPVLGRRIHRQGYISEVKSIISEFMQYGLSPEDIDNLTGSLKGKGALGCKLADLRLIYKEFREYIAENYITREEKLSILRELLPKSGILPGSCVVYDGFTGFTPIQLDVIEDIMAIADETVVSLELGAGENISECTGMQNLFYLSGKTYAALTKRARDRGIELAQNDYCTDTGRKNEIEFLEKRLFRVGRHLKYGVESTADGAAMQGAVCGADPSEKNCIQGSSDSAIRMYTASNPAEEVRQAGLEIFRLLQANADLQFRDISVVSGDLEGYAPYFEREFSKMGIPFYIDRTIRLGPLTEGVRSILGLFIRGFSAEAVFHYIRCGISGIEPDEADRLEVYIRRTGIRGHKAWSRRFARKTDDMCESDETGLEELNKTREKFIEEIQLFCKGEVGNLTANTKETVSSFVGRLYDFLVGIGAAEKMNKYAEEFAAGGDLVREKEYSLIYRKIMELLEQVNSLMGDDVISLGEFYEILDAGFGEIRVGTIPQTVDKILVGDIEMTRVPNVRYLFFMGVNDGNIPKNTDKGGIISDLEREDIREKGIELAPTPREEMYIQRLYLYMNMTKPSDGLYISWAQLDSAGRSLRPSYLCEVIKRMFPAIKVEVPEDAPGSTQIVTHKEGLIFLGEDLRRYAEGGSTGESEIYTLYSAYGDEKTIEKRRMLEDAAFARYSPEKLSEELSEKLYCDASEGDEAILRSSISRLETYASCPYKFFLTYGLALREDNEFGIDQRDTGNVFHEVLDLFSKRLKKDGKTWKDFDDEYAQETISAILEEVTDVYGASVFQDTARNRQSLKRLKNMLLSSVLSIRYQIKKGGFEPKELEVPFKRECDMKPSNSGKVRKLRLRGKIDRVDTAGLSDQIYVRIVDYKSSDKKIDPVKIYEGRQLQLPMYLSQEIKRIRDEGKKAYPAAMLYYHVDDPLIETGSEKTRDELELKRRKAMRMKGLVADDENVIALNDYDLEKKDGESDVINVAYKRDGSFTKGSEVGSEKVIRSIMTYCEDISVKKGGEILDGNIEIAPADKDVCKYCAYKASCSYDRKIPGYGKVGAAGIKADEALEKILKAAEEKRTGEVSADGNTPKDGGSEE